MSTPNSKDFIIIPGANAVWFAVCKKCGGCLPHKTGEGEILHALSEHSHLAEPALLTLVEYAATDDLLRALGVPEEYLLPVPGEDLSDKE